MAKFNFIKEREKNISKETRVFVKKTYDILDRIHEIMKMKNISQKDLAKRLDKSEPEISKWINGNQNFTIKTLCKLEAALDEEILITPIERNITPIKRNIEEQKLQTKVWVISSNDLISHTGKWHPLQPVEKNIEEQKLQSKVLVISSNNLISHARKWHSLQQVEVKIPQYFYLNEPEIPYHSIHTKFSPKDENEKMDYGIGV